MDNTLTIDGVSVSLFKGATYLDAIRRIGAGREQTAVAVLTPGGIRSLSDEAQPGQTVRTIDLSDEEGRRVYERSLRFVFLLAVHQMYPGKRVRFENSMGGGIYVTLPDDVLLSSPTVRRIQTRMRELVAADLPFTCRDVPQSEALDYFRACGWDDKVELLRYRPDKTFRLYECGGFREYFYGAMLDLTK